MDIAHLLNLDHLGVGFDTHGIAALRREVLGSRWVAGRHPAAAMPTDRDSLAFAAVMASMLVLFAASFFVSDDEAPAARIDAHSHIAATVHHG